MAKDNNTGMLSYLLSIFVGFLGPLIIYMTLKEKTGTNYENAKNALNLQLSVLLYSIICLPLLLVLIGFILLPAISIFNLVVCIIGTMKANSGEVYKAPLIISFIK